MVDNITFAIMTCDVLNAPISDLSFRVYAEIYVCNYNSITQITDKMLADAMGRTVVTINRAIHDLEKHGLVEITSKNNRRSITTRYWLKSTEKTETKCLPEQKKSLPPALQAFFDLWGDHQ